jgi:hypothetical protein
MLLREIIPVYTVRILQNPQIQNVELEIVKADGTFCMNFSWFSSGQPGE